MDVDGDGEEDGEDCGRGGIQLLMNSVQLRGDAMDAALVLRHIHNIIVAGGYMSGTRTHTSSNRTPLYEGHVYFNPSIGDFLVCFPHIDPEPHRRIAARCLFANYRLAFPSRVGHAVETIGHLGFGRWRAR